MTTLHMLRLTVLAATAASAIGCTHQADVVMRDHSTISGEIVRADGESVFVRDAGGEETAVARADIADIDHPGDASAIAGGVLAGLGVVGAVPSVIVLATTSDGGDLSGIGVFFGALGLGGSLALIGAGVPMLVWGIGAHGDSADKAEAASVRLSPSASYDPVTGSWNAGFELEL